MFRIDRSHDCVSRWVSPTIKYLHIDWASARSISNPVSKLLNIFGEALSRMDVWVSEKMFVHTCIKLEKTGVH